MGDKVPAGWPQEATSSMGESEKKGKRRSPPLLIFVPDLEMLSALKVQRLLFCLFLLENDM